MRLSVDNARNPRQSLICRSQSLICRGQSLICRGQRMIFRSLIFRGLIFRGDSEISPVVVLQVTGSGGGERECDERQPTRQFINTVPVAGRDIRDVSMKFNHF